MSGNLEQLLEDGVIDEVLGRLKSGKEADVWLVRHREEVLAAKVYKERSQRSFKNNSGYKEGRTVRNTRTQRAMDRGSRFGQEAAEEAWKSAESDALHRLHAQGVRVPAPVLFYEGILLMKLVLDAEGHPAPRLIDVAFEPAAAADAYADLRAQAVRMLCSDLIHGDLSAYNVLMAVEGPTIIDFPQVISAAQNSTAAEYFKRDIENLRTFFGGFEPSLLLRNGDGHEIWQAYVRRDLTPEFVPSGKPMREPEPRVHKQGARQHGGGPGAGAERAHPRGPRQDRPAQGARGQHAAPHASASRAAGPAQPAQGKQPRHEPRGPAHGQQPRHGPRGQPQGQQPRHEPRGPAQGRPPRHDSRGPPPHHPAGSTARPSRPQHARPAPVVERVSRPLPQGHHPKPGARPPRR